MLTKQRRLEQASFLKSIAEDFSLHNQNFLEAWPVLIKHQDIPKIMPEHEWTQVVDALTSCYSSVRFLVRIARLVKARVIDRELLYILYFDEATGYLTQKLSFLIKWCGTGLDLAADYDPYELARVTEALIAFNKDFNAIHAQHGADLDKEGDLASLSRFEDRAQDFLADPGRFVVDSDNYIDNYVEAKE